MARSPFVPSLLAALLVPAVALAQAVDCDAVIAETVSGDPVHVQLRIDSPLPGAREVHLDTPCTVTVTGIASAVGIPALLDFYLIIDESGSTGAPSGVDVDGDGVIGSGPDSIHAAEIAAARSFIASVDLAFSRVAIIRFSTGSALVVEPTSSRARLEEALRLLSAFSPGGNTNYAGAQELVLGTSRRWGDPAHEQVALLLTDGAPTNGDREPGDAPCPGFDEHECAAIRWVARLRDEGITLDSFALGLSVNMRTLDAMAAEGGGESRQLRVPGDIVTVLPNLPHVRIRAVRVRNRTLGVERVADVRPDGHFTAMVDVAPGRNELTAYAYPQDAISGALGCDTDVDVTCVAWRCPDPIDAACDGSLGADVAAWAADAGSAEVRIDHDSPFARAPGADAAGRYGVGATRVTWTFAAGGETRSCDSFVNVADMVAPVLTAPWTDLTVSCAAAMPDNPPVATDECDPAPRLEVTTRQELHGCPWRYDVIRTWTATDAAGHATTLEQRVSVDDRQPPALFGVGADERVECVAPPPPVVAARDLCDPAPTVTLDERVEPGGCPQRIRIVRTWTGRDACGNEATAQQVITVVDETAPTLTGVPADLRVECAAPPAPFVAASDACDPAPSVTLDERIVPGDCPHRFQVVRTWTGRDACGNEATAQQVITVVDETAPTLTGVPADLRVECAAPPAPSVAASDACDPAPSVTLDERIVPGDCPYRFQVARTWTGRDACGNETSARQVVTVVDELPPVLVGVPGDVRVRCTAVPPPASVGATDACDPAPAVSFAERTIPGDCPGRYRIVRTWTARDACANAASATQTVTVYDDTPPAVEPSTREVARLWPPRHDLVLVPWSSLDLRATDDCSPPITWRIVECSSDQPDDGRGDGHTVGDCAIDPAGRGVLVRSERTGLDPNGRHYRVSAVATDACGNASAPSPVGTIFVPHDQRDKR